MDVIQPVASKPPKKTGYVIMVIFGLIAVFAIGLFLGKTVLNKPISMDKPQDQPKTEPIQPSSDDQKPPKETKNINDMLLAQSKIKKFNNAEELQQFLENEPSGQSYTRGMSGGMMEEGGGMISTADNPANISTGTSDSAQSFSKYSGSTGSYSQTNVQVEGVDEADIIKTDGKNIYAVSNNNLFIVKAAPAEEAEVLAKIAFKSNPQNIYLNENFLVVYGNDKSVYQDFDAKIFPPRRSSFTFVKIFDVLDPKNPVLKRDLDFEGYYYNSRMIGDYLYFLTSTRNFNYYEPMPRPIILENGKVINQSATKDEIGDIYYFDLPYDSYNFTHVAAINLKDPTSKINSEVYVMDNGQNMYVSPNAIYLTYTKRLNKDLVVFELVKELLLPDFPEKMRTKIAEIEAVPNSILSPEEKLDKIEKIFRRYDQSLSEEERDKLEEKMEKAMKEKMKELAPEVEKTVIHKINIAKGEIVYACFGEVTGTTLNQFSMDEFDGYFRIATTKNQQWSGFQDEESEKSYNNLYILDKDLKITGKVEKLAEDERIYSVRFMQGRAYMVTFKQTDPLFVIDVKDPKNPKVLGKLKIPGFSSYLHPYDDETLIGLGKDADENGRTKGLKLSLFDVSKVEEPKEIDSYIMGDSGSSSIALNEHKAFLFSKEKNLLVIPVNIYVQDNPNTPRSTNDSNFNGAAVFSIKKEGIELKGKIGHKQGNLEGKISRSSNPSIKRSLYIEDILYTFSNQFLKLNQINDLKEVKMLEMKKEKNDKPDDFEVVN